MMQTVSEKSCLLGFLSYLKGLDQPVVLLSHCKDSLLPTLLAKLTYYKLMGRGKHYLKYVVTLMNSGRKSTQVS